MSRKTGGNAAAAPHPKDGAVQSVTLRHPKDGADQGDKKTYESFFNIFIARFKRNRMGMFAFWSIVALIVVGVFAPFIANDAPVFLVKDGRVYFPGLHEYPQFRAADWRSPGFTWSFAVFPLVRQSPVRSDLPGRLQKPSREHLCGTDDLGMDVFARIVWGTRISISIGIISAVLTLVIGTFFGAVAGYFGGWIDAVISRFIEIMMCFPTFFLILAVLAFLPPSIYNIIVVIGLTSWTGIARLVRGDAMRVKNLDYVRAAKVNGAPGFAIILRHIVPNSITPALISTAFNVAGAILLESSLSFLGFGVQPPTPSWGAIIQVAYAYLLSDTGAWLSLFPAVAIFFTVTSYNLLGQAIRDAADPKLIE